MEDKDIYMLFSSVAERPAVHDESVRKVFSSLIKSTLRYRDQMLKSRGAGPTSASARSSTTPP